MVSVKEVAGLIVLMIVGIILMNVAIENPDTLFSGALFWGGVALIVIPIAFLVLMFFRG